MLRAKCCSFRQDVLGPFGKSAWDVAAMLSAMTGSSHDYTSHVSSHNADLGKFKLGIWDSAPRVPTLPASDPPDEVMSRFHAAVAKIRLAHPECIKLDSARIVPPREPPKETGEEAVPPGFRNGVWHGSAISLLLSVDLHEAITTHLKCVQGCGVRDIDEFVKWNDEHPVSDKFVVHISAL